MFPQTIGKSTWTRYTSAKMAYGTKVKSGKMRIPYIKLGYDFPRYKAHA